MSLTSGRWWLVVAALAPAALSAQTQELDALAGRWDQTGGMGSYELRLGSPLSGSIRQALSLTTLIHDSLGRNRAFYGVGYELQVLRGRRALGPYFVTGVALGLSSDTAHQEVAALWSVGGGVEWRPLQAFGLLAEARYRVEDRGPRGFWSPGDPHKGFSVAVGLSIGWNSRPSTGGPSRPPQPERLPPASTAARLPPEPPTTITGGAADVVHTALDVLGTPYQWGGTAQNGFDCSGLIQYAYGRHGIRLPRISRDQAHAGTEIPPVLEALQPGDILVFSATAGAGVTHVGMYVGEGKFIHSSTSGVRLSRLDLNDPDGAYWIPRWVGARRIIS